MDNGSSNLYSLSRVNEHDWNPPKSYFMLDTVESVQRCPKLLLGFGVTFPTISVYVFIDRDNIWWYWIAALINVTG